MRNSIYESASIYKYLVEIKICERLSQIAIKHIMTILITMYSLGYRGKTVDFSRNSPHHRTTIAHFLNQGKWDDRAVEKILKQAVIERIYGEAERTGQPILCIVDDTIASKTKPSSQALHPIQDAGFHYSHLKRKQDYGHQAVSLLLSCNGITLHYAVVLYDKETASKIQIVCELAAELPIVPVISYFLCDSWYTCKEVMNAFFAKGFYSVAALKTNRIIFPCGIRQQIGEFAKYLRKSDRNVRLVTVGSRQFYVYRYEGALNGVDSAVVLLCYPKDSFRKVGTLRAFLCTDCALSTEYILDLYSRRWQIEVFFRRCKSQLAFDQYQIRSSLGIRRFWLLTSLAYFFCCSAPVELPSFDAGLAFFRNQISRERISFIYFAGLHHADLDDLLALAA